MRANLETLVAVARKHGTATASEGRWRARLNHGDVMVYHYSTLMLAVGPDDEVTPICMGYGSMTDKCGIRKVLRNVNGKGYAEVYSGF